MFAATPLQLSLVVLICLFVTFSLIVTGFTSKQPITLFLGVIIGILGSVAAVVSMIKVYQVWGTELSKKLLVLASFINGIYLLIITIIFLFIIWIFIGYRNGL